MIALVVCMLGQTPQPSALVMKANSAYEQGQYADSAALYEQVLELGFHNSDLYYNLGNAHLRAGELGHAIAAYRRALVLAPRDQDAVANLRFAREQIADALPPPRSSPVLRTLFFWHYGLSVAELRGLTLTFNFLLWLLLGLYAWRPRFGSARVLAWGSFVLTFVLGVSWGIRAWSPSAVAVVTSEDVAVRAGTDEQAVIRFKLGAGAEVKAVEEDDAWIRVQLPSGEQGWLPQDAVDVVRG